MESFGLYHEDTQLVIGVLTGHAQLNCHLSIMGLVSDPSCNQCGVVCITLSLPV